MFRKCTAKQSDWMICRQSVVANQTLISATCQSSKQFRNFEYRFQTFELLTKSLKIKAIKHTHTPKTVCRADRTYDDSDWTTGGQKGLRGWTHRTTEGPVTWSSKQVSICKTSVPVKIGCRRKRFETNGAYLVLIFQTKLMTVMTVEVAMTAKT